MVKVINSKNFTKKLEFRIEGRPSKFGKDLMDLSIEGPLEEFIHALETIKKFNSCLKLIHKIDSEKGDA